MDKPRNAAAAAALAGAIVLAFIPAGILSLAVSLLAGYATIWPDRPLESQLPMLLWVAWPPGSFLRGYLLLAIGLRIGHWLVREADWPRLARGGLLVLATLHFLVGPQRFAWIRTPLEVTVSGAAIETDAALIAAGWPFLLVRLCAFLLGGVLAVRGALKAFEWHADADDGPRPTPNGEPQATDFPRP
jgi:hypothetical protein